MNILPGNMRFGAGQPVRRLEDQRLLTGKGQFIDDKPEEGALWLYVLRSPHAHAKIVSIDTAAAAGMPGVQAVYTGADLVRDDIGTIPTLAIFKRPDGTPMTVPPRRLLAHEIVRYAGEAVAAVVATSRVLAQTAAEAIAVDYEVLPSVVDPLEAIKPGAPVVWPEAPDNVVAAMSYGDAAKVEEAFASAAHKVSLDLVSQRLIPSAMEPRSTIAEIDKKSGRLILHVQSQTPASTRDVLAEAVLKRPKESVRVLVGDIGGGFGQKTNLYPEDGIVAYAATKLGKKIRWRGDRTDEFVGGTHGRDLTSTAEFALDAKGRVQAYRVRSVGGTGAYSFRRGQHHSAGARTLRADRRLRSAAGAFRSEVGDDQHRTRRRLSRRRAARGGIHRRAADGCRRAPDRNRSAHHPQGELHQAGAAALHQCRWPGVRLRRLRAHAVARLRAGGLGWFCRAQEGGEEEGPALRPRPHQLHRMDRRARAYRKGQPACDSRGPHRPAFRHHGDGAGAADHLHPDGVGYARHRHGQDRRGAGRHGSRHRFRQRRLALAVRRRHGGRRLDQRHDQQGARESLERAGNLDRGYRISRRLADGGRHRQAHQPVRDREEGRRRAAKRRFRRRSRRAELAERHAYLRSRDRSGNRRQQGGALHHGRRRRHRRQSDAGDRPGAWRRRAGHRTGAV